MVERPYPAARACAGLEGSRLIAAHGSSNWIADVSRWGQKAADRIVKQLQRLLSDRHIESGHRLIRNSICRRGYNHPVPRLIDE